MREIKLAAVCLLLLLFAVGCWDQQPIDRLTIVFGLGFDPAGDGGQRLRLNTSSPVFERDALSGHVVMEAEGKSFIDALRMQQRQSNAMLVLGKVKVVVFNAGLSRKGIESILHQLDRNFQFDTRAFLLVTENSAADIIRFTPQATERVGTYIEEMLLTDVIQVSAVPLVRHADFMRKLESRYDHGYIPLLSIVAEGKALQLAGLAVFRGGQMVGQYGLDETLAVMLINGELWDKTYTFEPEGGDGEIITVRIIGGKRRVKATELGFRPEIQIRYTAKAGYLEEHEAAEKIFEPEKVAQIEKALSASLSELANRVVKKQQEFGSDIFGIGSYLAAYYPDYMNSIDWEGTFPKADIKIAVDIRLDRVGIRQN